MKRNLIIVLVMGLAMSLALTGCAQKAESSKDAIDATKSIETVEEKVTYLVKQAEAFYKSEDFQEAIDIAQYILSSLDKDSQAAKSIIEKAKEALSAKAQAAVEDVKKKLPGFGQ